MKRSITLALLVLLLAIGHPSTATADDQEALQGHIAAGVAHFKAKKYKEALDDFLQAYMYEQEPNIIFNIARCYEELEEFDSSLKFFQKFIELTPQKEGQKEALGKIQELSAKLEKGKLILSVTPTAAAVTIDGKKVDRTSKTFAVWLGQGIHEIEVTHEGLATQSTTAKIIKQKTRKVTIELVAASSVPPDGTLPPDGSSKGFPYVLTGWITLGASVVFMGTGIGMYAAAESERGEIRDADTGGIVTTITQKQAKELEDSGDTYSKLSTTFLVTGGVLAATAGVLLYLGYTQPVATGEAGPIAAPLVLPGGGGVAIQGSF